MAAERHVQHAVQDGRPKVRSPESEYLRRSASIDTGRRGGIEVGGRDNLRWHWVADRKWHVGTHHDPLGADHPDDEAQQHTRVMQDGVGVDARQRFNRIAKSWVSCALRVSRPSRNGRPALPIGTMNFTFG